MSCTGIKNTDGIDSPAPLRFEGLTIGFALRSAVNVAIYTADQEDRKMVMPSRFVALSVLLTLKASPFQTANSTKTSRRHPSSGLDMA